MEYFSNDFRTTLASGISPSDTALVLTSVDGVGLNPAPPAPFRLRIGNELIRVGARTGTTCANLERGAEGTAAAAHLPGATVRHVLTVQGLNAAISSNGITGPAGPTGSTGPTGPIGPPGATGPAGSPGTAGAAGPPGAQGTPGIPGPVGPVGPAGPGTGNVIGPAGAVADRVATYNGTTGTLIKDGGKTIAEIITAAQAVTGNVAGPISSVDGEAAVFDGTTGKYIKRAVGTGYAKLVAGVLTAAPLRGALGFVLDGGGNVITPGVKGFVEVPFACTIVAATLLSADPAVTPGSIVVDIWKDSYANYAPTVADTITAAAKPTLAAANKSRDVTLAGWTTSVAAGDVLGFKVDSAAIVTRVSLTLTVQVA